MTPDAPDQAAQVPAHLASGRRFAGAQDHRHRAGRGGVVDVDRQEAALIVMGVEQGELLVAMHHVDGVVDVQRHRGRRCRIAGAPDIDHHRHQAKDLAQGRRILPARHGRLRAQVPPTVG